jgi:hypothetical protein
MILRRLSGNLKQQNWTAIAIELLIVILGVFIGTQVSNWNADRLEKVETRRMLEQLGPSLKSLTDYFETARSYYAITRGYAGVALRGWSGDAKVGDRDFVVAAYQASQITGIGTNGASWATVLGADRLRKVDDPRIRDGLSFLMATDYSNIDVGAVDTPYRRNVRRVIPLELQDRIRVSCGDRANPAKPLFVMLPKTCDLAIAPAEAADVARRLRAAPQLAEDLNWHMAAVAALLANLDSFELTTHDLQRRTASLP